MIILEFIYNGSPISVVPFPDLEFTESGRDLIISMLKRGLIRRPADYDRIEFYPDRQNVIWRG